MSIGEQYTCAHCGSTFEKTRSDEEMRAEYARAFPMYPDGPCALFCDDCFAALVTWAQTDAQFSVYQFFADGRWERLCERQTPRVAFDTAVNYTRSVGAKIGTTFRVVITDGGDAVIWEWRNGEGVIWPPPSEPAAN